MELLLQKQYKFTLDNVTENGLLPFEVNQDFHTIAVKLSYGPKAIADKDIIMPQIQKCIDKYYPDNVKLSEEDMNEYQALFNFVTISLDDPDGYLGCAHRHHPEQTITISEDFSTDGFAFKKVQKGTWRVVLHVQAVVEIGRASCRERVLRLV